MLVLNSEAVMAPVPLGTSLNEEEHDKTLRWKAPPFSGGERHSPLTEHDPAVASNVDVDTKMSLNVMVMPPSAIKRPA